MSSTDTRMTYIRAQVAETGLSPDQIEGYGNYGIRKENGWYMFLVLAVLIIGIGWIRKPLHG
jgi:hypothetical protein